MTRTGVRVVSVILLVCCITMAALMSQTKDDTAGEALDAAQENARVAAGCVLVQTMRYTRCGHEVTRRLVCESEDVGLTREQMQEKYDTWTFTTFQAGEITMRCEIELHCPLHYVLMPDEAGQLCIFQNLYGDGLAFIKRLDTRLSDFSEAEQENLRRGIGFDTVEHLEQWLEATES